ncbi:MAG: hypothetical protein QXS83_02780, partial [Thermoplasmata archaeon]
VRSLLRQRMIEAKLRTVQIGNIWKLTEMTKKQREVLKKMNAPVPSRLNIVIKGGGVKVAWMWWVSMQSKNE